MMGKIMFWARVPFVRAFNVVAGLAYKSLAINSHIFRPSRIEGKKYISIGCGTSVQKYTWLFAAPLDGHEPELTIGEGCAIGEANHIAAIRRVVIGKHVLTANRVYISDNLHSYEDVNVPIMHQRVAFNGEVSIGDGSWIGENACILGVKVGKHCVIGANAVVTKDLPDYSVAVGAPARIIRRYNFDARRWEAV